MQLLISLLIFQQSKKLCNNGDLFVFIGNKQVIHKGHITNGKKGSEVRIESLHKFAGKGKIVKNNSLDKKMR